MQMFDYDDWGVSERIFRLLNRLWGEFTCNLFADSKNFKVKKYSIRFWNSGSADLFMFS